MAKKSYKPIRLVKLVEVLTAAIEKAKPVHKTADVEFWLGEDCLELDSIGQFGLKPDVTIHLRKEGLIGKTHSVTRRSQ